MQHTEIQTSLKIAALIGRHIKGELNTTETQELESWMDASPENRIMVEELMNKDIRETEWENLQQYNGEQVLAAILTKAGADRKIKRLWFIRFAAAAAILLLLGGISMKFVLDRLQIPPGRALQYTNDPPPGSRKAKLVMANGNAVALGIGKDTTFTEKNGTEIKQTNGQLVYSSAGNNLLAYNLLTTPVGGEYEITLTDGTHVWLNAASSIRYPTTFSGKERKVEITGEVYFEVARNAKMPFKVKVNEQLEIEVLGTHFNVNAYKEEATVNTTLLEGAVRLKTNSQLQLLKPGQQARVNGAGGIRILANVDTEQAVAWKNGLFNFEDVSLQEMMRQLSRWYDIEVVYEGKVPEMRFGGKMVRNLSLSQLLKVLEQSKVHFRMEEGRKVIVTQ